MTSMGRRNLRTFWLWVLLAPFLLLSLLSPAVMPARAADGTLTLVLCTDGEVTELVIDLATGKPVEKAPADSRDRCDWAAGHWSVASLLWAEAPAPIVLRVRPATPPPATVLLALSHATGLPPATGPPAAI
ncbi:MAG: hypothetical protein R3D63_17195 [Paracoccaceae bacterium]